MRCYSPYSMVDYFTIHSVVMYIILYFVTGVLSQFLPQSLYQNPGMPGGISPQSMGMMMPSMQMPGFPQRLPVMVMPFHSKLADRKYIRRKKRQPKKVYTDSESTSDSDSGSSSSSIEHLRTQKHRYGHSHRKKKRQVLTPVISYVTRNGRVVYQKKIKKENAGDWLEIGKRKIPSKLVEEEERNSGEMTIREMKNKYGIRHNHRNDED